MNDSLLQEFLAEECDDVVRDALVEQISKHEGTDRIEDFTFNRFNIRINFKAGEVVIEDDLDVSEEGELKVPLSVFYLALRSNPKPL